MTDPDKGRSFRWYLTPREVLSDVLGGAPWWVAGVLVAILLSGIGVYTFAREESGDRDAAAAVCEDYVRSQPNVPASATLDYDVEAGGDDFVIDGFVLGEGLADGLTAERVPVGRILSDGRSSFFSCTVRYHGGDDRYELLRSSVTMVPAQP